ALPLRLGEELVRIGRLIFLRRVACHAHVAAERDERDAIVGRAAAEAEQPLAEAEGKDEHAHAEELRHEEMPRLVREDEEPEDDDEGDEVGWDVLNHDDDQRSTATAIPRASLRAQRSQAKASSTEAIG